MKTGFLPAVLACCILLSVPQYASSDTAFNGLWGRAIESINNKTKDGVGSWASAMNWDPQAAFEQLKSALDNPDASSVDTSDSINKDNSLLEELDKAIKQPMNTALSLIQSLLVDDTKTEKAAAAAAAGEAKAASASDVLSDIQSYLMNEVSTKDSRQLAAIALLQGYALTSLIKTLKDKGIGIPGIIPSSSTGSTAALAEMAVSAAAATNPLSTTSSSNIGSNRGPIAYPIPEPSFSGFNSLVCMRLSNFASAEGYRSVYFGSRDNCNTAAQHASSSSSSPSPSSLLFSGFPSLPPAPAGETSSTASVVDEISWGDQASFTLDCQIKSSSISHSLMQYPSDIAAALGWSSPSSSSSSSSASGMGGMGAAQKQLQCYLSITTDTGSGIAGGGAILQKSIPLSIFTVLGGEVQPDALSLRFCNVMSSPSPPSTTTTNSNSNNNKDSNNARVPKPWSLNRFKLNGKALPGVGLSYQVPASTRGGGEEWCQQMMLHVAPAALQPDKGFTLTGWIDFGGDGGGVKSYGVGRLGSFEVKVGEYKLIDGRKAFAAMMGSGSGVGSVGE